MIPDLLSTHSIYGHPIMHMYTRTVYGAAAQTAANRNLTYIPPDHSTLNEKFSIQELAVLEAGEGHSITHFVIGNNGHRAAVGADGFAYTSANNHQPTDAACYGHLPFIIRPITDDLTIAERANYALRRQETHGGVDYFVYYAKKLDVSGATVILNKTNIDAGISTTVPFEPTTDNLNPTPLEPTAGTNIIESSGEFVSASSAVTILFDANDATELRNAALIIHGSEEYALISEIGFLTSVEHVVTEGAVTYTELVQASIAIFVSCYYQMVMQTNGFEFIADAGITEPLLIIG